MEQEYGVFWGDKLYTDAPKKEAIIDNILYKGDTMCISSDPGTGKSVLLLQLLANLTTRQAFLDTYAVREKQNVLYVQTEGERGETLDRAECMKKGLSIDDSRWVHINLPGLKLNTQAGLMELVEKAREPKMEFGTTMFDPLYTTIEGSMSTDEIATDWIRNIRTFKSLFKCSIIAAHHEVKENIYKGQPYRRKKGNVFGSVFWGAFFNTVFKFTEYKGIHYLECGKQRSGKIIDKIEMKLLEPKPLMFVNDDANLELTTIKLSKFMKEHMDEKTVKKIVRESGIPQASVYRAIKRLRANNLISNIEEEGESYYIWKEK